MRFLLDRKMFSRFSRFRASLVGSKIWDLVSKLSAQARREKFIGLIDCSPKEHEDAETVVSKVDARLSKDGVVSELLHVEVNGEIVPVHRRIHHSWKQLVKRVHKHRGDKPLENVTLKIRELPLTHRNSMVTSTTGSRLHVFRFTFTA